MPRNKHSNDDLEDQEINLLPDEMRAAEEKYKKSTKSKEEPYQLRAPKKKKKRRRVLEWLPFFGGMHWGVEDSEGEEETPHIQEPGAIMQRVAIEEEDMKSDKEATAAHDANIPEEIIKPIVEPPDKVPMPGMPRVKRSFKKGVRFPGLSKLFSSRKGTSGVPTGGLGVPQHGRSSTPPEQYPSRHYSLLESDEKKQMKDQLQADATEIPLYEGSKDKLEIQGMRTLPQKGDEDASDKKKRRGVVFTIPRWLDIFYLLGRLSSRGHSKKKGMPKKSAQPVFGIKGLSLTREKHAQSPASSESKGPEADTNVLRGNRRHVHVHTMGAHKETPQVGDRSERVRKPWKLPHWLDMFYIFGFIFGKKTTQVRKPAPLPRRSSEMSQREGVPGTVKTSLPVTPKPAPPGAPTTAVSASPEFPYVATDKKIVQRKKPWRIPRWLDIFHIVGALFGKKASKKPVPFDTSQARPEFKKEESLKVSAQPVTPEVIKATEAASPPVPPKPAPMPVLASGMPETPEPSHEKQEAEKKPWHLPKWLDIFHLLRLLFGKKKGKKVKRTRNNNHEESHKPIAVPEPPVTPVPSQTPKELPHEVPTIPHITPPEPPAQDAHAVDTMKSPASSPVTPIVSDITTTIPKHDEPITPVAGHYESAGQLQEDKKGSGEERGVFHLPKKFQIDELSRDAREVNLIPTELSLRSWKRASQLLVIAAVATIGLLGAIYGGLNLWRSVIESRTAALDTQILKFKNEILVYQNQEPEMSAIGNRVQTINSLLSRHIYWTQFFTLLERYTLPDVYYDGLSATTNGTLSLSAHGSNFETISRLLRLLNSAEAKEFVTGASITGAQRSSISDEASQVTFSVELVLNPDLFFYGDTDSQ